MATAGHPDGVGFDAVFVQTLDTRFTCPICQLALKEPKQTECGHHFCASCLTSSLGRAPLCPICRTKLSASKFFPDNALKREILDVKIMCDLHEQGCEWVGHLGKRDGHEKQCRYVIEECHYKCGKKLMRKGMRDHKEKHCPRRKVSCKHCGSNMQWLQLQSHFETCRRYPVICHYNCGKTLPWNQIANHIGRRGTCPNSPLHCDFKDSGCQFKGTRNELLKHIETTTASHLSLLAMEQAQTRQTLDKSKQELQTTKERLEDELAATREKLEAELATTKRNFEGELAVARVELAGMKQKLADTEHKLVKVELQLSEELIRRSLSLPPHQPEQFIHEWRIENWSQKVLDARRQHITMINSKSFYVYPGYHLCLRCYLNGVSRDSLFHLGVYLWPITGTFDSSIKWPFPFTFVLEVVDQQSDGISISETHSPPHGGGLQNPTSEGVGTPKMASHETLLLRCYIKDDAVLIRLTVRLEKLGRESCRQQ